MLSLWEGSPFIVCCFSLCILTSSPADAAWLCISSAYTGLDWLLFLHKENYIKDPHFHSMNWKGIYLDNPLTHFYKIYFKLCLEKLKMSIAWDSLIAVLFIFFMLDNQKAFFFFFESSNWTLGNRGTCIHLCMQIISYNTGFSVRKPQTLLVVVANDVKGNHGVQLFLCFWST